MPYISITWWVEAKTEKNDGVGLMVANPLTFFGLS